MYSIGGIADNLNEIISLFAIDPGTIYEKMKLAVKQVYHYM
jgi:hypothetical protein